MGEVDRRTRPRLPQTPRPHPRRPTGGTQKRTLTNLYNQRPQWLANAHANLDTAVAYAYGWDADIPDEDALRELLELNQARQRTSD